MTPTEALIAALHEWFCGEPVKHGDKNRPHIGWACERGGRKMATRLAQDGWEMKHSDDVLDHAALHAGAGD